MLLQSTLIAVVVYLGSTWISPLYNLYKGAAPTVILDSATVTGVPDGSVSKFLGIPFAQPPTGQFRFRLPQPIPAYNESFLATAYGPSCPQQSLTLPVPASGLVAETLDYLTDTIYNVVTPSAEDCLTVNVVTPANATPDSALPVVVWIFGGGFEDGSTSTYNGGTIANRAIELDVPVVYVSVNYRLSAFGFLASQEVKDAGVGNLGLQDQRQALRWVQQYIRAFGGDPTKVTIWGESAGAFSATFHMLTNGGDTEGLFRAAFMESGSAYPVGDISRGQPYYDALVADTGCATAADTLDCLRGVPYDTLLAAVDRSPSIFAYQSLVLAWQPRVDGVFLKAEPQALVEQGSVADIPFIVGDCDDEGTLFSLSTLNITTSAQFAEYIQTIWLPHVPPEVIAGLLEMYPEDPAAGSPFNTFDLNAITPQFKRIAAFQGDYVFQAPRRFFLQQRSGKQKAWSFLSKRHKRIPVLGSFHASDLLEIYGPSDMTDYLVRFAANLEPGGDTGIPWPPYTAEAPSMLTFLDGPVPLAVTQDTYRAEAMAYITNMTLAYPI
ncbi:Alpha/Beta hydrolase protein [Hygrophoropsis aurantiaca]|uniref:Alpha/Beta hydrolase protein n=1 Tax=Hygrophoropsis aurantiaca TaxID=72124 RepID=A0ACB7ZQG8_9AGAM|nr:Alpha/Beta hydrolase protein [Hygrophoropsis aurantiaca]